MLNLFLNIILLIVGFVALIKGADFFVDGSSALAKIFKVSSGNKRLTELLFVNRL
jgi:Ca2+/Na+ antiporter